MSEEVREIYLDLWTLCKDTDRPLRHRYRSLRESFERIARERMQNVALQATDLAARINYLSAQFSLEDSVKNALHTFRLTSNSLFKVSIVIHLVITKRMLIPHHQRFLF